MQEKPFYSPEMHAASPHSQRIAYVDGAAGTLFRKGTDVELSHWLGNQTEERYKAGTSTEICFKYLKENQSLPYDAVINNHLDIDGLLSAFVMCYPTIAQQHRETLIQAAEAGDFWAWAEGKAMALFQELSILYKHLEKKGINLQDAYKDCFQCILEILEASHKKTAAESLLSQQLLWVQEGIIQRSELSPHFVTYFVPKSLTQGRVKDFLEIPAFNEVISDRLPFWSQVRNYQDAQKVQLVAVETNTGIHYDLWYPGYAWADTHGLWLPPGLQQIPETLTHIIHWPALEKCMRSLNTQETGPCHWHVFPSFSFSGQRNPRKFPVVASTLNEKDQPEESHLPFTVVFPAFQDVFKEIPALGGLRGV